MKSGRALADVLNSKVKKLNREYDGKVFKIKAGLVLKLLKCPFMYNKFLRRIVMEVRLSLLKLKTKNNI
jgi:hypothetical protein